MPICLRHIIFCLLLLLTCQAAGAQESRLLHSPAISQSGIAFVYANDIWLCGLQGGAARRLTTFTGAETLPHFSPDGKQIAFSGEYDGNTDVYVVSVQGGEPRRLTWHPMNDEVRGWSKDGKYILFTSDRNSVPASYPKFWRVSAQGGLPEALPMPRAAEGKYSPDGQQFVYQKIEPWEPEWRNYRGGQNNPLRIIDLHTLAVKKLPWNGANDNSPVWLEKTIYFLSDRDQTMNVWSYNLIDNKVEQHTFFTKFDCKHLEAGGGRLIFENGGWLYLLDPASDKPKKLAITVQGDFPLARPHWEGVGGQIATWDLSPTGQRAVFEARGDIFTVPAEKGDVRNLTTSSGVADRSPAWSPDGKQISWFSDEGGEYQLIIADQYGKNKQKIKLKNPTFFYTPAWSPDSEKISFSDADRNLWLLTLKNKKVRLIANEGFTNPERVIAPIWSPDSKWIAYTKRLKNQYKAIFLYSLEQNKSFQLTDGLSDSMSPAWDASGKYLYFLASTNFGLNVGWLDMSSADRSVSRAIYLVVLSKDEPSPLRPESDEENKAENDSEKDIQEDKKKEEQQEADDKSKEEEKPVEVKIDLQDIDQRVVALHLPEGDYSQLAAGKEKTIFYIERNKEAEAWPLKNGIILHRFSLKDKEPADLFKNVWNYTLSADRKKILCQKDWENWAIVAADTPPEPSEGNIATRGMRMRVVPQQEWQQIFREAWRFQRDYFYVENVHGLDLDWAYAAYAPWVKFVRHRADLNYILSILGGETSVGHAFTGGGDIPYLPATPIGLLGADFSIRAGKYQLKKIYQGENWNPGMRAPLSGPGIDAQEGDFLLAVNGVALDSSMNPYSLFEETAGKQTVLTLNKKPVMKGSREVTVVPTFYDNWLRRRSWIEENRKKVDQLSGGKLAYIWLPNTSTGGYDSFNRYYFAQQDKQGAIIDERFNHGGMVPDYIIDLLGRDLLGFFNNAVGTHQPFTLPNAGIWGPKVMLINDAAGSGGDLLPYMFRQRKIGPLLGTRTWGGLVGIWDVPPLIDGGRFTVPRGGFYNLQGEWDVENKGIEPDIVVEQDPAAVNKSHDPQLEKAVEVALDLLKTEAVKILPQPPDPVRVHRTGQQ